MKNNSGKIKDIAYISVFSVFIAVCAWICVPMSVAFTMQSFGVFLTLGVLGGKRGTISVAVYILMGLIGLPVFAGFGGGLGVLMGSSGGYLIGFLFVAIIMWLAECVFGKSKRVYLISMLIGLMVCYIIGTLWFMLIYTAKADNITLLIAFSTCVFPFIIPDILKIFLALSLIDRITKILKI